MKDYKTIFEEITKAVNDANTKAVSIRANFGTFCPNTQYITIDALKAEDYPNGIADNSIYLRFRLDLNAQKVELHSCGHVWLSKADAESEKYKYFAMKSAQNVHADLGGKAFRKQSYKDAKDLAKKIHKYFNAVMESLTIYTGGYPYKEGK